jgi:cyclic pyranopterin phosphate synthase
MQNDLQDSFGRRFSYVRLSVTDACNFRCQYCLPHGYKRDPDRENYLSLDEIRNLVSAFAGMGVWKIRLTGGEPTLRNDLIEIVREVAAVPGIRRVALSTNGYRLKDWAGELFHAGLRALNVSVDTLDRERFQAVTGRDCLPEILGGIETAFRAGFTWVKVNAVLMRGVNDDGITAFQEWVRTRPVTVRFIELMPTGQTVEWFRERHLRGSELTDRWLSDGWLPRVREEGDGPAQEFTHPDYRGRIGIIAPYSRDFCGTCNRLRVNSFGALQLCLFGESPASLRPLLQTAEQKEALQAAICQQLLRKEISHYLPEGRYGNNQTFSAIGG